MSGNVNDEYPEKGNSLYKEEKVLIQEIKKGNARAFKYLVNKFFKDLTGFAYEYVRSSHVAKDVVQDVFANIWERRDTWNPTYSLKMYLYQSVKNEALKKVRDQETERKYIEAYIKEHNKRAVLPKEPDKSNEFRRAAQQAIQELPDRARLAYKLHRRDGLTYKEIAMVMDISHKTVESQMSRALRILRDKLSSYLPSTILVVLFKIISL